MYLELQRTIVYKGLSIRDTNQKLNFKYLIFIVEIYGNLGCKCWTTVLIFSSIAQLYLGQVSSLELILNFVSPSYLLNCFYMGSDILKKPTYL